MKAVATDGTHQSNVADDALRLVVDTTPALIHTGRPDGHLDYFNQRWLDFLAGCETGSSCLLPGRSPHWSSSQVRAVAQERPAANFL
jgi:hypothetical protein